MTVWDEGYTSTINYIAGYDGELSPTRIRLALLSCGIEHSISDDPEYLELGFGQGVTLNIHAATSSGQFWGNDFNPGQVANARQLADAMGKPITLLEDSFEQMAARDDLPQFDIIALHGIWSWVSDSARAAIVEIARKALKPGGALYIGHNVTPGWSPAWPLRTLLSEYAKREGSGPLLNRVEESMNFVDRVIGANAAYFVQHPQLAARLEQMKSRDRSYVAHEYFNANWYPMPFSEVADRLADAKLGFAASATIVNNLPGLSIPEAAHEILQSITDPVMRETTRDYFANQQFRRDIFVKGARNLSAYDYRRRIDASKFMLLGEPEKCPDKIQAPIGEVELPVDTYRSVLEELAKFPDATASIAELVAAAGNPLLDAAQIWKIMLVLTTIDFVAPVSTSTTPGEDQAAAQSLNRELLDRAQAGDGSDFLAAPRLGVAMGVSRIEQMLLRAMLKGDKDPPEAVREALQDLNQFLIVEGQPTQDQALAAKELKRIFKEFKGYRAALLKRAGVC